MSLMAIPPLCLANNRKRKALEWLRSATIDERQSVKLQKFDEKTMKRILAMSLAKLKLKCLNAPDGSSNPTTLRCITKDLNPIPSPSEILKIRRQNTNRLLRDNKLILVLDLDHTLLHTVDYKTLTLNEEISLRFDHQNDIFEWGGSSVTKLRPHVRTFLKEASKMYDMYIYTMGSRAYALQMAKFLDPEGVYFTSKVISREDCTRQKKKRLDVVLGKKRMTVIIDDKESVWKKHRKNLLVIDKYYFFTGHEKKYDDVALMIKLHTLKSIHQFFFSSWATEQSDERDVRDVMRGMICSS